MDPSQLGVELARVTNRQLPMFPREARTVCSEINLAETEAKRLREEGLLSFDPGETQVLDESREAELIFVGSLVATGCGRKLIRAMLADLAPPYAYDLRCIFFDFRLGRWRLFPSMHDPESAFFALLERLDAAREDEVLRAIRTWIDEALDLAHDRNVFFEHLRRREQPGSNDGGDGDGNRPGPA